MATIPPDLATLFERLRAVCHAINNAGELEHRRVRAAVAHFEFEVAPMLDTIDLQALVDEIAATAVASATAPERNGDLTVAQMAMFTQFQTIGSITGVAPHPDFKGPNPADPLDADATDAIVAQILSQQFDPLKPHEFELAPNMSIFCRSCGRRLSDVIHMLAKSTR